MMPRDALRPARKGTVLLAEDEPVLRELSTRVLEKEGYEVRSTAHGTEALELLRADPEPVGLVVLDWRLPGCTGAELLKLLYSIRPDLSILVATGGGGDGLRSLRPPETGSLRILRKPYRSYELLAMAAAMFAERERVSSAQAI